MMRRVPVPEDVLSLVFDEATKCHHGLEWPNAEYDYDRAAAPFVLAAVCQQWRIMARAHARYWTYFAFPTGVNQYPMQAARARLLLELSGDTVLDLILLFDQPDRHSVYDYTEPTLAVIFDIIQKVSHRWRNVRLRLPSGVAVGLCSTLQGHTPRLETLSVACNAKWDFLPRAARLSRLYVECHSVDQLHTMGTRFPMLSETVISPSGADVLVFIRDWYSLNRLTSLCILGSCSEIPRISLSLPHLDRLILKDPKFLLHIRAPILRHLALHLPLENNLRFDLQEPLQRMSSVTDLQVYGTLQRDDFEILGSLPSVETLVFSCPVEIQMSFPCNPEFYFQEDCLSVLNRGTTPAWPSLQAIQFGKPSDNNQVPTTLDAGDLLEFIVTRHISEVTSSLARATRKIERVGLYNTLAPPQFLEDLSALFTTEIR